MGKKFAVVTVSDKTASAIEDDITLYGLSRRAIVRPVRTISPASDSDLLLETVDDPKRSFIPRFESVAAECIQDGAEVIVVGCGYYGPLLRAVGYTEIPGTGVTVLDATSVAIKYLEAMTDISKSMGYVKSSANSWPHPPQIFLIAHGTAYYVSETLDVDCRNQASHNPHHHHR